MPDDAIAFQDLIADNYCFGCGADNPEGMQIKSFWDGEAESICRYQPVARAKAVRSGALIAHEPGIGRSTAGRTSVL